MNYTIEAPVIDITGYPEILYVDRSSELFLKSHLGQMALHFKSEMKYDHLQYDEDMYDNNDYTGFLLPIPARDLVQHEKHFPVRIIGGGIFIQTDIGYELDWVWLHPFARNRGNLSGKWRYFKNKFGTFTLSHPISAQMQKVIEKIL